jgi:hypothetical protein
VSHICYFIQIFISWSHIRSFILAEIKIIYTKVDWEINIAKFHHLNQI